MGAGRTVKVVSTYQISALTFVKKEKKKKNSLHDSFVSFLLII